jgi:redox-sensitive bicupin YhaK (pirin superfamily)
MFLYVYTGAVQISPSGGAAGPLVAAGNLVRLTGAGVLTLRAAEAEVETAGEALGVGALFIAGRPIGEPIVQHGPFVMTTREEIMQCFNDYQRGEICQKQLSYREYS